MNKRTFITRFLVVVVFVIAGFTATHESTAEDSTGLTFIHLNDTYRVGAVEDGMRGGFGRVVTVIRELQAAIDDTQKFVTGLVRLKLYKGNVMVIGRKSPYSLYDEEVVTFEEDSVYDQKDAEGFIKLQALRLRTMAQSRSIDM